MGHFRAGVQLLEEVVSEESLTGTRRDRLSDDAFKALLEGHMNQGYKLAWAIVGNDEDAADSMQDAFTAAWRHRASLRDPAAFEPWFARILVNCSRNRLRHRARQRVVVPLSSFRGPPGFSLRSGTCLYYTYRYTMP